MAKPRKDRLADKRRKKSKALSKKAAPPLTSTQADLATRINAIPSMPLPDLGSVVDEARSECNVSLQSFVIEACLERILGKPPRNEQVRTLRRLIFGKGDTLLIARTGWGKSIIFHAFSVLTRTITLQIIPLSKLGDEQLEDIRGLGDTRPVLITADTKAKEKRLFQRIRDREFTHVLLGPEQASSPAFRELLKEPTMQAAIGLVAIDECHVIRQWAGFRPKFTMIGELRMILRRDVVWFACSATLDSETQELVLKSAGFR